MGGRAAAVALVALTLVGCGGIRVASVANPRVSELPTRVVEPPVRFVLGVVEDAVVHSYEPWRNTPLGAEEWLRSGTDVGRGVHWVSYLRFDLSTVPPATSVASATLQLPLAEDASVGTFKYAVHGVTSEWDEGSVTWARQPGVTPGPIARGESYLDELAMYDSVDVTRVVNRAIEQDARYIDFAILPGAPETGGVRGWPSREGTPLEAASSDTVVSLNISAGPPPAPPSAAERDLMSGGRENLGEP